MTNSRSKASRSKLLAIVLLVAWAGIAEAGGRKRVVVLELDGPKSDEFHEGIEKLIRKNHTVVPIKKWNSTAEALNADTLNEKNVKKVAHKLKIDAIVTGKIEKRRDEYILRLRLREGKTGETYGSMIDTKAEGPEIDGKAKRDLNDELIDQIANIETNHSGGSADDEEDEAPVVKKGAKAADEEEEDKPVVKKGGKKVAEADEEEDKPVAKKDDKKKKDAKKATDEEEDKPTGKKGFSKKGLMADEEEDKPVAKKDDKKKKDAKKVVDEEEDKPVPKKEDKKAEKKIEKKAPAEDEEDKPRKSEKKVASTEDEDKEGVEKEGESEPVTADARLAPNERALDGVVGLSITARRLSFNTRADLANKPPGYRGAPVAGAMLDVTFFPLAISHTRKDVLKDVGLYLMYDKVIKIDTQGKSMDGMTNVTYPTSQSRYAFGAVFRYPFSKSPSSAVVGGTLGYSSQTFSIGAASGNSPDIPSVSYTILEPGGFFKYPVTDKIVIGATAKFMLVTDTGAIQAQTQYGAATVLGFEGGIGADYSITPNIFARAMFNIETIGLSFQGKGNMTSMRDGDATSIDVGGARDTYFGGIATVGYLY